MKNNELFTRAKEVMPSGVNSPVRAFGSVGGVPRFIKKGLGANIFDVEGKKYLDYIGSWGPMILGHCDSRVLEGIRETIEDGLSFGAATELEVEMAEMITSIVKNCDMVRMVSSGTEAVMSAIRLARGYTKKDKIIKFRGCYHGHCDAMLVKAGSGALTFGNPDSAGVTLGAAKDTLIAEYNDLDSVEKLFLENMNEVASVIVEPVGANMGVVPPNENFLRGLKTLCEKHNALLIFDEVITGFRLSLGGAQEFFDVDADIIVFGKIIGGGMPVGAYCSRKEIMSHISPLGSVYQAGTLSGNPVAMRSGLETLKILKNNPQIYESINAKAKTLADGIRKITKNTVNQIGSLLCVFMTKHCVENFDDALLSDTKKYAEYFNYMLDSGIYLAPAQFEAMFISNAMTDEDIKYTLEVISKYDGLK